MSSPRADSFLNKRFREFYREVIRLKRKVREGGWVFDAGDGKGEAEGDGVGRQRATAIWQRLLTLLERQSLLALRAGGDFAEGMYRQAQYVMAALADEVFLHLDWGGSAAWSSDLLESKLFKSHQAGEEVFRRLDELLFHRDPVYIDLAEIYLQALALGFQGKYREDPEGPLHLAAYQRKLLEFIADREPDLLAEADRLVPEAYSATLDQGSGRRLPYMRPWFLALGGIVVAWVLVGHFIWRDLIAEMKPIVDQIVGWG